MKGYSLSLNDTRNPIPRSTRAIPRWQCPNCGQFYFGDPPPDTCDYCQDFTTWQPIEQAHPNNHQHATEDNHAPPAITQPPLFPTDDTDAP